MESSGRVKGKTGATGEVKANYRRLCASDYKSCTLRWKTGTRTKEGL